MNLIPFECSWAAHKQVCVQRHIHSSMSQSPTSSIVFLQNNKQKDNKNKTHCWAKGEEKKCDVSICQDQQNNRTIDWPSDRTHYHRSGSSTTGFGEAHTHYTMFRTQQNKKQQLQDNTEIRQTLHFCNCVCVCVGATWLCLSATSFAPFYYASIFFVVCC